MTTDPTYIPEASVGPETQKIQYCLTDETIKVGISDVFKKPKGVRLPTMLHLELLRPR